MIHLEEFNHFDSYFDFNQTTGEAALSPSRDNRFFGYLYFLQPDLVAALYRKAGILTLQIGRDTWQSNPGFVTSYQHQDGGTTVFTLLQDGITVYEYSYPSWWQRPDSFFNVAEGSPPDEEEDYLAYVHYSFEFERAGKKRESMWYSIN